MLVDPFCVGYTIPRSSYTIIWLRLNFMALNFVLFAPSHSQKKLEKFLRNQLLTADLQQAAGKENIAWRTRKGVLFSETS